MAKITYLSVKDTVPPTGYWDHAYISDVFASFGEGDRDVVVIPGAYQWDVIDEINVRLAEFKKILVIVTSDEECKFNVNKLKHPDMVVYTQYGNGGWMFPLGYAPKTRDILKQIGPIKKDLNWFFSGQITHYRRQMLETELKKRDDGIIVSTKGFSKGFAQYEYLRYLARAKVAPIAPGPFSVDSFRVWESLEAGCIPVADDTSPMRSAPDRYWDKIFRGAQFPVFNNYEWLTKFIDWALSEKINSNDVYAWYINWKYQFRDQLKQDLGIPADDLAVIIPVSPIPSHPDTSILEETIRTIRVHTDAPILLTFDGVREEQSYMTENYEEFKRRMLWKCNFELQNVLPVIFPKHVHQSGMMKAVLENITTPLIMYVEHDAPLTPDWPIPIKELGERIKNKESNLIRFHYENFIPEPHRYLMVGEPVNDLQATRQWSQRPHLASTEFYRWVMNEYFTENSNTFIEDRMHGICQTNPWEMFHMHIYHPEGPIKRTYHLDGRQGGEKYDDKLVY